MNHARVLVFLGSMTCLVAWNAEAAPHDQPEASAHGAKADPQARVKLARADRPHAGEPGKTNPAKAPAAKANGPISPSATAKADAPGASGKVAPLAGSRAGAKVETHAEGKPVGKQEAKEGEAPRPERSYWLAANPHVPLAFVEGGTIHPVGKHNQDDCGSKARWARTKSRWRVVDAWGQMTGSVTLRSSHLNQRTSCHEVSFEGEEGDEPYVLLVSEDSSWKPSATLAWAPTKEERKHFYALTATLEKLWVHGKLRGEVPPLSQRVLFFQAPAPKWANENHPTRWAVVGGPILVVAYLDEHDHWKVANVQNSHGMADSYQPSAVFDMNGDGIPEIIYHTSDGPLWDDRVMSLWPGNLSWTDIAVSLGGGTV